jgi:SAM-dependent methyltransferase
MEWYENEDFWNHLYPFMFPAERFTAAKAEVDCIIKLAQCSGGKLLDLCCGPGRHAVQFAQRGFQVTAVDRSPVLLNRAREHAAQTGAAVEWVKEDMRRFIRPATFDVACNLFTSFGYFKDEQDNLQVLRNLHHCLKDGGVLVMEMVGKERLARMWQSSICAEQADGTLLLERRQLREDWSRILSEWILIKDGETRRFSIEHSIYSGRELKDRLLSCGFQEVWLFGDLLGSPYDQEATWLVAIARKIVV